jgi:xanthine phosphoribosyltransferase
MRDMAKEFKSRFDLTGLTAVLTVEASGIPLATICAEEFGVPMVFAKKAKSDNIEGGLYKSDIYSYTYKKKFTLIVASQWLGSNDKVLIIDDFIANGEALRGLVEIVDEAGAELLGIGIAIEKGFQPGGQRLREAGIHIESLAIIESADETGIVFRGE